MKKYKYIFSMTFMIYCLITMGCYYLLLFFGVDFWGEFNFLTSISDNAANLFISSAAFFLLGTFTSEYLSLNEDWAVKAIVVSNSKLNAKFDPILAAKLSMLICFLNVFLVSFLIYFIGDSFWYREYYQVSNDAGGIVDLLQSSLGQIVGLLPALALYLRGEKIIERYLVNISIIFSTIFLYGISTKFVTAALLFYAVSGHIKYSKINSTITFFYLLAPVFLILTLTQRIVGVYGVFSLSEVIKLIAYDPISSISFSLQVITSAIFITAESISATEINYNYLFVEINPLPGSIAGWYKIYESRRINDAIPLNALGTVHSYGFLLTYIFGFFVSYVVGLFKLFVLRVSKKNVILFTIFFGVMLCALITQYNLRSVMRWVYYCLVLSGMFLFFYKVKNAKAN